MCAPPGEWNAHANPIATPIDAPDPECDKGWIIIRHHESLSNAEAYCDAVDDYEFAFPSDFDRAKSPIYHCRGEYFTLVHRPAIPGRREPVIIYSTKVPHEAIGWDDWSCAIGT